MDRRLDEVLRDYLSPRWCDLWRRRGIDDLLPLQHQAIRETGLLSGKNLLALAPASSGKTLIGELALVRALSRSRRGMLLVPTRALAEQAYDAWQLLSADTGCRVICSTSDRPESDQQVAGGRWDVLIAVYEKVRAFLATDTRLLAGVGVVVVDEIQSLDDPGRGGGLELLLMQLLQSAYNPQLVTLGPPMSNPAPLANWLRSELLQGRGRTRSLREGVLVGSTGIFHYHEADSGTCPFEAAGEEPWISPSDLEKRTRSVEEAAFANRQTPGREATILGVSARLAAEKGPALLFAPTRRCARRWALWLAAVRPGFSPARVALAALRRSSAAGQIREKLAEALNAGIGFHSADLPRDLRNLVEEAFESGEIPLLISTPTLALGVNLQANTVIHTPWRLGSALEISDAEIFGERSYELAPKDRGSVSLPLGRARFAQQGGRAARFGRGRGPGYSVLVARNEEEARTWWDQFMVAPEVFLKRPPMQGWSDSEVVLGLLAGGVRRTIENFEAEWAATLSSHLMRRSTPEVLHRRLGGILQSLEDEGLVRCGMDGLWGLTGAGETAVRFELPPAMINVLRQAILHWQARDPGMLREFQLLFELVSTPRGQEAIAPIPLTRPRQPLPLPESLDSEAWDDHWEKRWGSGGLSRKDARAWVGACMMLDWSQGLDTVRLEEKYGVYAGSIASAAESLARLGFATAGLARVILSDEDGAAELVEWGERLIHGVGWPGLAWARLRIPGLSRDAIARLIESGMPDPFKLGRADLAELASLIGDDQAQLLAARCGWETTTSKDGPLRRIKDGVRAQASGEDFRSQPPITSVRETDPARLPLLEINLQSPGIVWAKGREIRLPPLGYDLLVALAERPGEVVTRAALYHRLWPEGGPEDQQLDAHRRRLIGRLKTALGPDAERVGEVVRGMGFRFGAPSMHVRIQRGGTAPSNRVASPAPRSAKC